MKYKILKDYVNWNRDTIKAGGTVELGETPATSFYGALLANGFIQEIKDGEFGDGDDYWHDGSCGRTYEYNWADDNADKFRLSQNNAFHTMEEAEEYLEYLKAKAVLRADTKGHRFINGKRNFTVYRDELQGLKLDYYPMPELGQLHFASEEDAQNSIKAHEKEWHLALNYELKNGA